MTDATMAFTDLPAFILKSEGASTEILWILQQACEQLFLTPPHLDVGYVIISDIDFKVISEMVGQMITTNEAGEVVTLPVAESLLPSQVVLLLNKTTGNMINIYASSHLAQGTIIFSTYHDNSRAPTLSQEDILSGKF